MQVDDTHTRTRSTRQRTRLPCSLYDVVVAGDTCGSIAAFNSISLATLLDFNLGTSLNCSHLVVGFSACVGQEVASAETMMQDNLLTHTPIPRLNRRILCNNFGGHEVCHGSAAVRAHSLSPFHSCCRL